MSAASRRRLWASPEKSLGALSAIVIGIIGFIVAKGMMHSGMAPSQTNVAARVDEGLKQAVAQIRPTLPRKMDDSTTLVEVSSNGMVLSYFYRFDSENYELQPNFMQIAKLATAGLVCKAEDMRSAMRVGAVYEYRYSDANSRLLGGYVVTAADCR
jgi:hypothetical protein